MTLAPMPIRRNAAQQPASFLDDLAMISRRHGVHLYGPINLVNNDPDSYLELDLELAWDYESQEYKRDA